MGDSFALAVARLLATAINPLFVLLLLAAPFLKNSRQPAFGPRVSFAAGLRWFVYCAIGVAFPVVLAELGKRYQIWSGHPWFPSGHETFAVSAATCLIIGHPRWAPLAVLLVVIMAWALVRAGYHNVDDILGALALGAICAVGVGAALRVGQGLQSSGGL